MKIASNITLCLFYLFAFLPIFGSKFFDAIILIVGVAWFIILIILLYKKNKIWKRHLLLSPLIVVTLFCFLKSIASFSIGKGTLMLNHKNTNIHFFSNKDFDYTYRLYYHNYDGEHYGSISLLSYGSYYSYLINDYTLKGLVGAFGYQAKMYNGKIPNREELYHSFATEKIEKVFLDEAAIGYAKFTYRGKAIKLYKHDNFESCLKGEGGYGLLDDVRIPIDSNTYSVSTKAMRKGAHIFIMSKYYPLLYNVYNTNGEDFEFEIIDAENEKILSRHYFERIISSETPPSKTGK